MTDREITEKLNEFNDEIFHHCPDREKAADIKRRLDTFCKENHVSFEQMQLLADSGAGEMLCMMTS